ncbi:MAG: hypothetical protein J5J06_14405 [Phycisphaerae bacterium]|nr:hypothetical protein [Phycisphaerae bacterium]
MYQVGGDTIASGLFIHLSFWVIGYLLGLFFPPLFPLWIIGIYGSG